MPRETLAAIPKGTQIGGNVQGRTRVFDIRKSGGFAVERKVDQQIDIAVVPHVAARHGPLQDEAAALVGIDGQKFGKRRSLAQQILRKRRLDRLQGRRLRCGRCGGIVMARGIIFPSAVRFKGFGIPSRALQIAVEQAQHFDG
jgi:hypothetical protein